MKTGFGDETKLEDSIQNINYDPERYENYSLTTRKNLMRVNDEIIDYDLLEDLISFIDLESPKGSILVFLPGIGEIQNIRERLSGSRQFGGENSFWIIPLHSSVAPGDQKKAFQQPPEGIRKIVLATNIAETSITIEDAVYVVDSGKLKETRFDAKRGMESLVEAWISRANARQRAGRAGRVRPGQCFSLYTKHRLETLMHPYQLPEIQRVPLVELCLQTKLLGLGSISSFLLKAIEPPKSETVTSALEILQEVGALDEREELTALGRHLASLPVDVRIGKMMIYGTVFGCIDSVLTIAACLSYKSPFFSPPDQKDAAERARVAMATERGKERGRGGRQSDHLAMVAAYEGWRTAIQKGGSRGGRDFCTKNFLSVSTLEMLREMRDQFARLLADIGFFSSPSGRWHPGMADDPKLIWNRNAQHDAVVKAVLCAGLYPKIAIMDEESIINGNTISGSSLVLEPNGRPRWTDGRVEIAIHPSSVNSSVKQFQWPFMVYHEKVKTSRVFIRDCSTISPSALLLFGGPLSVKHMLGKVSVGGWIEVSCAAQTGVFFKQIRTAVDLTLRDKVGRPQENVDSKSSNDIVSLIVELLLSEDKRTS